MKPAAGIPKAKAVVRTQNIYREGYDHDTADF